MDSECDLFEGLKSLSTNIPDTIFYHIFVDMNFIESLFELMTHENEGDFNFLSLIYIDISSLGMEILHEMISHDNFLSDEDAFKLLIKALVIWFV